MQYVSSDSAQPPTPKQQPADTDAIAVSPSAKSSAVQAEQTQCGCASACDVACKSNAAVDPWHNIGTEFWSQALRGGVKPQLCSIQKADMENRRNRYLPHAHQSLEAWHTSTSTCSLPSLSRPARSADYGSMPFTHTRVHHTCRCCISWRGRNQTYC